MDYRLKPDYILSGGDKKPWVLVRYQENQARRLGQEDFQILLMSGGMTDVDVEQEKISDGMKTTLRRLEGGYADRISRVAGDTNTKYCKDHVEGGIGRKGAFHE